MFKGLIYNGVDYSDRFQISDKGELYSLKSKRILKVYVGKEGYVQVCTSLGQRGKYKTFRIHRAVGCTFIPNPENKPEVNHKDLNKLNNYASNLEWNTESENTQHAADNGRLNRTTKKLVLNITNNEIFESINSAGLWIFNQYNAIGDVDTFRKSISRCCNGKRPTAYGYKWGFI